MPRRTRPRDRKPYDPFYWTQVQRHLVCWPVQGERHDVTPGRWMRFRRNDHRRMGECEDCLRARGVHRPTKSFTFTGQAASDEKRRQTGERDE